MQSRTRFWILPVVLVAAAPALGGCGSTEVTPSPAATPVTSSEAAGLVEEPLRQLAADLSSTPGAGTFEEAKSPVTATEAGWCEYTSTSYVAAGTPAADQWGVIAETAAPVVSGLGMDPEGWLTDQTPSGAGLVAAAPSGMEFTAMPTAEEGSDPGTYSGIRIRISLPLPSDQC